MSVPAPSQTLAAKPQTSSKSTHVGLALQRKCACGSPTSLLSGECAECKSKNGLQAKLNIGASNDPLEQEADRVADQVLAAPAHSAVSAAPPRIQRYAGPSPQHAGTAPASVGRVLSGAGRPLEPALQQDMGQRFGHDFSRVRVHCGAAAEQSARDVNAHAYTVGHDIVFGAGRFAPKTHEGRRLIAHELTHVVQQGSGLVQRKIDIEDFESGEFSLSSLETYLKNFGPGNIEDDSDSDDKARRIVQLWRAGKIQLDADKKILLIEEMVSGFTGNDDERAILTLLFNSDQDLAAIFGAKGGIDPEDLDDEFHEEEEDELREFFDRKFVGGREAALESSRKLKSTSDGDKAAGEGDGAAAKAAKPAKPERVPRKGEKDIVVLLDPKLSAAAITIAPGATTLEPGSPAALGILLKGIKHPIRTLFFFGHADDSAAIKFGNAWVPPSRLAKALDGTVSPDLAPDLADFRGCRVGMSPPGMEEIRAALRARAAVGATCWMMTLPNGPFSLDGHAVVSAKQRARFTEERLSEGLKAVLDSFDKARKCVLDPSLDAYFRAGGKLVAAWYSPTRNTAFDPLYSRCVSSLTPKVVDPEKATKGQSSISSKCQLIQVEGKAITGPASSPKEKKK